MISLEFCSKSTQTQDQRQQACVVPICHDGQPATAVLRDGFQGSRLANGRIKAKQTNHNKWVFWRLSLVYFMDWH